MRRLSALGVPHIWDLAQCNECKAEIQVTRFHCFQCGEGENEGYDLCRSCLPEGMRKHNPKHQFQIVEHLDMTIDTLQDFLVIIREPQTKWVKIRRPYPGVSVYEVRFGRKHLFYSTTLAAQVSQIARSFPQGLKVVKVAAEVCARELAEQERRAVQPLPGCAFTEMEVEYVMQATGACRERATQALAEYGSPETAVLFIGEQDEGGDLLDDDDDGDDGEEDGEDDEDAEMEDGDPATDEKDDGEDNNDNGDSEEVDDFESC
ncbi:zinc finger, zz type domain containing protein [Acanthamoeba castellanii str. Neff]|uniref:Zinc finger, zz type domain containing protein n=1 Tax=Acanthamoeba castellanii (strain ATCC 30010 / Neff) TaxID=1257118 RepID=L8GS84_ACACF|nr:zinc finger, zz type domain containing protein [Acanthamoeba castellanii str. Neff]ELR15463.1 zinc finger, zz type domain containing protein [Acanthamoeba castellanii str. Neff]